MPVARVVGFAGRMMIRIGVLILLFVAYQLWGTGLQTDRAQDGLGAQFRQAQERTGAPTTASAPTTTPGQAAPPVTTPPTPAPVTAPPEPGEAVGRLTIPDIDSDFYVVEGVDLRYLQEGPGHFPGTPMPGQPGNAAIAGHRVTWAAPFNRIDELDPGDRIHVETLQGSFTYEVIPQPGEPGGPPVGHYIITPTQTEILDDEGDNRLTLMACNPKYSAAQRIVVEARLVGEPAPATPTSSPGAPITLPDEALITGSDGSWPAAIAWSGAAVALWVAAWAVSRLLPRYRWASYVVALPVFALVLFQAFSAINLLMPAAY